MKSLTVMLCLSLVYMVPGLVVETSFASATLSVEPYYRIHMAIVSDTADAREVISRIQNSLVKQGIVMSEGKGDPVIGGRVVVEQDETKKANPYGMGDVSMHDVVMTIKELSVKDSAGITWASERSFSGYGSHEIKGRAFA